METLYFLQRYNTALNYNKKFEYILTVHVDILEFSDATLNPFGNTVTFVSGTLYND